MHFSTSQSELPIILQEWYLGKSDDVSPHSENGTQVNWIIWDQCQAPHKVGFEIHKVGLEHEW